jgi:hypothetical protein
MEWLISQIWTLIGLAIFLFLVAAVMAPLETLGWWAGWSKSSPKPLDPKAFQDTLVEDAKTPHKDYYAVYLSGIGVAAADGLAADEIDFINRLEEIMPTAAILTDVYPYSVANNPLTGQRALSPLWKKIRAIQEKKPESLIAMLAINVRNVMQVAVSADPRYGPIYSYGVAEEVARSLINHGYKYGSSQPIYLIGFSGGGQISVGSASYLASLLQAPIHVIGIGGLFSDDPGILHVKRLDQFFGEKDNLHGLGAIMWSGRWKMMVNSSWNRSFRKGKIKPINLGPMAHNAYGGYYDLDVKLPDGTPFCHATAEAVKNAIVAGV